MNNHISACVPKRKLAESSVMLEARTSDCMPARSSYWIDVDEILRHFNIGVQLDLDLSCVACVAHNIADGGNDACSISDTVFEPPCGPTTLESCTSANKNESRSLDIRALLSAKALASRLNHTLRHSNKMRTELSVHNQKGAPGK